MESLNYGATVEIKSDAELVVVSLSGIILFYQYLITLSRMFQMETIVLIILIVTTMFIPFTRGAQTLSLKIIKHWTVKASKRL